MTLATTSAPARPTGTKRGSGEGTRTPTAPIVGQRQVVAVPLHPDDDEPETGPGVEPGVEDGKLGRVSLHAHSGEGAASRRARRGEVVIGRGAGHAHGGAR